VGLDFSRIGIIGGNGKTGGWLARMLENRGIEVLIASRSTPLKPVDMARKCKVVVISVPITNTIQVIKEIGPLVPREGLLMDLTSVKKGPVEAMVKYSEAQVVGIHPLFGPNITSPDGLRIALCPGRGEEGLNWINKTFQEEGYLTSIIEPEEHDRLMGIVQGVNHLSTLALALCISRSGFHPERLKEISTVTFNDRFERIRALLDQPAELFGSLIMDNPLSNEFIEDYLSAVEEFIRLANKSNRKEFEQIYRSLQQYFNEVNET
jgi:prephenate dehydrogenase